MFEVEYMKFWKDFGTSKKMVLSTSLNDDVTSRMMSVVAIEEKLYFQTDNRFRKYAQMRNNNKVSLCIDNVSIEGNCVEVGIPLENADFCRNYKLCFPESFVRYSSLENERLFVVTPSFIERWIYMEGVPYIEVFDVTNQKYSLNKYEAE